MADFVGSAGTPSDTQSGTGLGSARPGGPRSAIKQIIADTVIFKEINLSSAKDLETADDRRRRYHKDHRGGPQVTWPLTLERP